MNHNKSNRERGREKRRSARDSRRPSQATARRLRGAGHSSHGQTADRVLIHADTEVGAKDLLNKRMAYVAVWRGAWA